MVSIGSERELNKKVEEMIQSLTDEEMEIAARCSYRYLRKSMSKDESEKPSKEIQKKIAKSMAKRHLVAGNGNKQNALTKMKNTIQFRSEMNVDGLRLCYDEENIESGDKEYQKLREGLDNEMLTPVCQIRGYDKDFRAPINAIVNEKTDGIFHPVEYVRIHLYMIERALACQERRTGGEEDCRFVIITDCNNFSLACGPPPSISKKMIELLANHYPERLHKFFFVDTPLIFRVFWNIVKYFLDPVTAAKISFVTGEEQRREIFSEYIDAEQAMPFSHPEGQLLSPFNAKKFMYEVPFDHTFDESK